MHSSGYLPCPSLCARMCVRNFSSRQRNMISNLGLPQCERNLILFIPATSIKLASVLSPQKLKATHLIFLSQLHTGFSLLPSDLPSPLRPRLARLTPAPASLRKHCSTTVHRSRSTPSLLSSFTDIVHYSLKPPKPVFLALPAPRYSSVTVLKPEPA